MGSLNSALPATRMPTPDIASTLSETLNFSLAETDAQLDTLRGIEQRLGIGEEKPQGSSQHVAPVPNGTAQQLDLLRHRLACISRSVQSIGNFVG